MTQRSKNDIPAEGRPLTETKMQSGLDQACMRTHEAEPVIPLNVELHQRLSHLGSAKASTLKSAMASLERLRQARGAR